nr:MAG TPA: hypothetical protein [Caudoviricetes sp.]
MVTLNWTGRDKPRPYLPSFRIVNPPSFRICNPKGILVRI